ncbi:MAG: ArsA family ATPase [Candidatus Aureabacteria bacterium]|nr:ArsA family ATPase [Candidatus Auribacterota bacterium]
MNIESRERSCPQIEIFLGKGGVGKTTLSSLRALQSSSKRQKTQLISFDPAHNLGDIFHLKIGEEYQYNTFLTLKEFDMEKRSRDYLSRLTHLLEGIYSYQKAFHLDHYLKLLELSPGVAEYVILLEFIDLLQSDVRGMRIVMDMPPTALSLRFMALPQVNNLWCQKLLFLREQIIDKKEILENIRGRRKGKANTKEPDKVYEKLLELNKKMITIQDIFQNRDLCRIQIVCTDERLSIMETQKIIQCLESLDLKVKTLYINKFESEEPGLSRHVSKELKDISKKVSHVVLVPFIRETDDMSHMINHVPEL